MLGWEGNKRKNCPPKYPPSENWPQFTLANTILHTSNCSIYHINHEPVCKLLLHNQLEFPLSTINRLLAPLIVLSISGHQENYQMPLPGPKAAPVLGKSDVTNFINACEPIWSCYRSDLAADDIIAKLSILKPWNHPGDHLVNEQILDKGNRHNIDEWNNENEEWDKVQVNSSGEEEEDSESMEKRDIHLDLEGGEKWKAIVCKKTEYASEPDWKKGIDQVRRGGNKTVHVVKEIPQDLISTRN